MIVGHLIFIGIFLGQRRLDSHQVHDPLYSPQASTNAMVTLQVNLHLPFSRVISQFVADMPDCFHDAVLLIVFCSFCSSTVIAAASPCILAVAIYSNHRN